MNLIFEVFYFGLSIATIGLLNLFHLFIHVTHYHITIITMCLFTINFPACFGLLTIFKQHIIKCIILKSFHATRSLPMVEKLKLEGNVRL